MVLRLAVLSDGAMTEKQRIRNVWFATEGGIRSLTRMFAMSSIGELVLDDEGMVFSAAAGELAVRRVRDVSLVRKRPPWLSLAFADAIAVIVVLVTAETVTPALLGVTAAMLAACNLAMAAASLGLRWVRVDFIDAEGAERCIHLSDGSAFGWGGLLGGTARLHRTLAQRFPGESPARDPRSKEEE
jgi:hypothetical protein